MLIVKLNMNSLVSLWISIEHSYLLIMPDILNKYLNKFVKIRRICYLFKLKMLV